jgi:thiamine biosynthesis lipoprotein
LGTLVEIGLPFAQAHHLPALWQVLDAVQAQMSAHATDSDLGRLHAAPVGQGVRVHPWTAEVLRLALAWQADSPVFDVARGTGRWGLHADDGAAVATRLDGDTRLDLGGLAKGWAVDRVVDTALALGVSALWVNAGGDLRTHGVALPIQLRVELQGGVQPWGLLEAGALATSDFRPGARATLWPGQAARSPASPRHVSVMADLCATADALTKVVAATGLHDPHTRGLLSRHGAQAWGHDVGLCASP